MVCSPWKVTAESKLEHGLLYGSDARGRLHLWKEKKAEDVRVQQGSVMHAQRGALIGSSLPVSAVEHHTRIMSGTSAALHGLPTA